MIAEDTEFMRPETSNMTSAPRAPSGVGQPVFASLSASMRTMVRSLESMCGRIPVSGVGGTYGRYIVPRYWSSTSAIPSLSSSLSVMSSPVSPTTGLFGSSGFPLSLSKSRSDVPNPSSMPSPFVSIRPSISTSKGGFWTEVPIPGQRVPPSTVPSIFA